MKIEKIEIINFRTLENVTVKFDGYFSSISGKNNAGKTSIIKAMRSIFREEEHEYSYFEESNLISYQDSLTQWVEKGTAIEFKYDLLIAEEADPGLYGFVKKIADMNNLGHQFVISIEVKLEDKTERYIKILVDGSELGKYETGEVFRRISSSNIVVFHNSASGSQRIFFGGASALMFHELILSKSEKEELKEEQERIKKRVRKFAQEQRTELSSLLGKLEEKYEVELTVFESMFGRTIPLGINLKDKGVEVPLDAWGAGTQNRTRIMMSILTASKIKQQINDENRVTPIIIIEEPESFLHPSAQAEFGRVIRSLARDLKIQIIITTHSPYMLCQDQPQSNILLCRKQVRGKLKATELVDVTTEKWMEPFANILGLNDESIEPWGDVVRASKDHAILVEGQIDKEYLEFIASLNIQGFKIPDGVEIIPYGGKDALKNSIMLKFVIDKFDRVYITFDLDAQAEMEKVMRQLGLSGDVDYMAVGIQGDGKACIEGLLPQRVHSKVYGDNTDLVLKLGSADTAKRKSAKNELKVKLLEEFKSADQVQASDLKEFKSLFLHIKKAFQ